MTPTDERSTRPHRVTQREIARLAGVSQATVSLVLNGRTDDSVRIADETRQRVLDVIAQTTYVADPAARRLAGLDNRIIGVFTYEPAFPLESLDFYTPLLSGIEAAAEEIGSDLLMFTSAPVVDGTRRLFHERNRVRLADGVLLLGVEMVEDDLRRLVDGDFTAVAVGRRDVPGIPYVGIDYATATATLVADAVARGHRDILYVHVDSHGESVRDRLAGVERGARGADLVSTPMGATVDDDWALVVEHRPDLLIVESSARATELRARALDVGFSVPGDLGMIALSAPTRPEERAADFTRLDPPRTELGARAVALLSRILAAGEPLPETELRTLIDCPTISGSTLATKETQE